MYGFWGTTFKGSVLPSTHEREETFVGRFFYFVGIATTSKRFIFVGPLNSGAVCCYFVVFLWDVTGCSIFRAGFVVYQKDLFFGVSFVNRH